MQIQITEKGHEYLASILPDTSHIAWHGAFDPETIAGIPTEAQI